MSTRFTDTTSRRTGYAPGKNAGAARVEGGRPQADMSGWPVQQQAEIQHYEQQAPPAVPPVVPPATPPAGNQQQQPAPVVFTPEQQAHLDRIAATARDEGRRAGMTEAQKKAEDDKAAVDAKALADQQQFKPLYETEQQKNAATVASFKEATIRNAVTAAATAKGFHNPAIALSLIDKSKAEVNESDWTMANAEALVTALATEHPYLVKPAEGGQQGAGGTGAASVQGYGPYAAANGGQGQARPVPGTPNAGGQGAGAPTINDERRAHIETVKKGMRQTDPRYR